MESKYQLKYMLYLAGCGAMGKQAEAPEREIDWNDLICQSGGQKLRPFVAYAIKKSENLGCPEEIKQELADELRVAGLRYHYGRMLLITLQKELGQAGISSAVLKGYSLAELYGVPELRMGCDVDLYVEKRDEKRAQDWFKKQGFQMVDERHWGEYHSQLKRADFGLLELHCRLHGDFDSLWWSYHSKENEDMWAPSEPFWALETKDGIMHTLGINDHAIFLCLHMVKHMIDDTKIVARMLLDLGVFFYRYEKDLNWERIWKTMASVRCAKLLCVVLKAAESLMGLSVNQQLPVMISEKDIETFLLIFRDTMMTEGEERVRVPHEFNMNALRNGKGKNTYKIRVLGRYIRGFRKRIQRHGFFGAVKLVRTRVRQVMLGKYEYIQAEESGMGQKSESKLEYLRTMGMM